MFECPITIQSKSVRMRKKLRFKYINYMHKYNLGKSKSSQTSSATGLPTPNNSEYEVTTEDDEAIRSSKRVRRKWKSIIGEAVSTDEEEYQLDDDEDDQNEARDEEKVFFDRYHKPESTYEIWQDDANNKKTPIQRKMVSYHKYHKLTKYSNKRMEASLSHASKKMRQNLEMIFDGHETVNDDYTENYIAQNYSRKHVTILTELLYKSVHSEQWQLAYRCFSMLIRIPKVNINNIWHVGNIILQHIDSETSTKFLKWMANVYSPRITHFVQSRTYASDPVYSNGSTRHTPLYTTTYLWQQIMKDTHNESAIDNMIDNLSELVLTPPFIEDPQIWYMYATCHLIKANTLTQKIATSTQESQSNYNTSSRRDIINNQIIQSLNSAKKYLAKSTKAKTFNSKTALMNSTIKQIEAKLQSANT